MLLAIDGINQSLTPLLLSTSSSSTHNTLLSTVVGQHNMGGISMGGLMDSSDAADNYISSIPQQMDIQSLPMEEILKSDWFTRNISSALNISMDNLTSLLINAQNTPHAAQRDPMPLLISLTVFYTLIFVAGVLGNLITCIVISRNKFMHTATNFYLFNLAVSDLILLLSGMPQDLYNIWYPDSYPFTDVLCIMESVLSETAANATVLTITAFTVERYIAICHPFRQHTMSKLSRAIKFIFAIWVTAFLLALPQAMQFSVVITPENGSSCTMQNDFFAHVFAVSGFIFFGGPMTAICVLYVLIGMKLKRSRLLQAVPRRCYDVQRGISAQSRVIRMLIAVAVAFFICWAPFHAQRLMAVYGSTSGITSELFNDIFHILTYISGVLYFLSTCINPLLYNIMSHKFREAFKMTLARHFGLAGRYQMQNHHNYSALLRQNGSMRLHTTVNNNALEHFNSYRVVQLQCRDPSHHLSLQDSIRTTTTTTTINSASGGCAGGGSITGGGAAGCGNSSKPRTRCISAGSQSTLLNSLNNKHDASYPVNNVTSQRANGLDNFQQQQQHNAHPHRMLQTQFSQLSSVGDAHSLMEADMGTHYHPHLNSHGHSHAPPNSSYRLKELRRSLLSGSKCHTPTSKSLADDSLSIDSQVWHRNSLDLSQHQQNNSINETQLFTKPVAPHIMAASLIAVQPLQPMNSVAEVDVGPTPRSRLKLSRIISRRNRDGPVTQSGTRVQLMRSQLNHIPLTANEFGNNTRPTQNKTKLHHHQRKTAKSMDSLTDRFRWRSRRKIPKKVKENGSTGALSSFRATNSVKRCARRDSSSSSASSPNTSTPTTALMQIVFPTSTAVTVAAETFLQPDLMLQGETVDYITPKSL